MFRLALLTREKIIDRQTVDEALGRETEPTSGGEPAGLAAALQAWIEAEAPADGTIYHRALAELERPLFEHALQRTGGVTLAADALIATVGEAGPHALLASLFALTAVTGLFISNTATAVLMTPVAIATAQETGLSPYPFAMIVALASSAAFMTPVSSPVNTLVMGPGRYRFSDFLRIGLPLAVLVMAVSVALVPLVLPLR